VREEFMIERQGKRFVLFAGLLDEAHSRGLCEIDTDLIQAPTEANENVAVVKCKVALIDEDGVRREFSGIGDASPDNVNRTIVLHLIRMAETRAKARALRDAVNVGVTAFEELGGDEDGDGGSPAQSIGGAQRGAARNAPVPNPTSARKSQKDLLRTLAVEWRGEGGVERLEARIGKPIDELTREEADEWIDRLTPEGR
jgi:hypothetical protein